MGSCFELWDMFPRFTVWLTAASKHQLVRHAGSNHVNSVSREWEMVRVVTEEGVYLHVETDGYIWYVTSPGAATSIAFLNSVYKNSHYFWASPVWEFMPGLYTIHLLNFAVLHESVYCDENYMYPENLKKPAFKQMHLQYSVIWNKLKKNMMNVRLINKAIMVFIGHYCVKTWCTSNINVPKQSKHRYSKYRAGHVSDTQGSPSTSFSSCGHGGKQFNRLSCQIPPMHKLWLKEC